MAGRRLGYARVSTDEQNLGYQVSALRHAGCERIYRDQGVSGSARHRPGLDRCLAALTPGDVLVVWKFDRAWRSLKHALDMLEELEARGIDFCELAHNIDTTSAMGRAFFHIRAAFAELESGLNSERTIAGMAAARARGIHVGRPFALSMEQITQTHRMVSEGEITVQHAADAFGVHPDTLRRGFRRYGLDQGGPHDAG